MTGRADLALRIAELVGSGLLEITDPGTGWPALGSLTVDGTPLAVALFVGRVGLSQRRRDEAERRFQNPGQGRPITPIPGRRSLLLGLWAEDPQLDVSRPLLVQADAGRRIGRATRFSVFTAVTGLQEASVTGWSEEISGSGEVIRCLLAPLLPVSVAAGLDGAIQTSDAMRAAIEGSGLMDFPELEMPAAAERARRAGSTLVRDARFSRQVILAYNGVCAMCGLDANLVQGAHIYPASAPGSRDEPWNGLALCPNHHLAFDRHLLAPHPDTRRILFCPSLRTQAESFAAMQSFVAGTFEQLAEPAQPNCRPLTQMFLNRYQYFAGSYNWIG
jgi:HNH endonuclease